MLKMAKRKAKRNARTSKLRGCFRICREPVVRFGRVIESSDAADSMSLPRICEEPVLFAIARDEHTIFVGWDIDWPSVFGKAMPVDRQVHLRLITGDDFEEKRVAVEPMLGSLYVSVSQPRTTYRVELGYYTLDRWKSVAISDPVAMPADAPSENTQVDVATVPLHISFQKLVDLLGLTNGDPFVTALSRLEDRIVAFAERDVDLAPADREILRALDISIEDLRSGRVSFAKRPNELRLDERAAAIPGFDGTSPTRGFGDSSGSQ
jgi:Domain of unknown function (DUF4912)